MDDWWAQMPALRAALFQSGERPKSFKAAVAADAVRQVVTAAPEFLGFVEQVQAAFDGWREAHVARLEVINVDTSPKALIVTLAEDLLERFRLLPLIDAYDVYQRLMEQWDGPEGSGGMGDDVGVLARDGWEAARRISPPGEGEAPEISVGSGRSKRRLKAELIPPELIVKRFFAAQAEAVAAAEADAERLAGEVEALEEEQGGDEGLLPDALDEKGALTEKAAKARAKTIKGDDGGRAPTVASPFAEEWDAIEAALDLLARRKAADAKAKALKAALDEATVARYAMLTEAEAKRLIVHDKWLLRLEAAVLAEVVRLGGELAGRVATLIARYRQPLPALVEARDTATTRVKEHLSAMGVAWN